MKKKRSKSQKVNEKANSLFISKIYKKLVINIMQVFINH